MTYRLGGSRLRGMPKFSKNDLVQYVRAPSDGEYENLTLGSTYIVEDTSRSGLQVKGVWYLQSMFEPAPSNPKPSRPTTNIEIPHDGLVLVSRMGTTLDSENLVLGIDPAARPGSMSDEDFEAYQATKASREGLYRQVSTRERLVGTLARWLIERDDPGYPEAAVPPETYLEMAEGIISPLEAGPVASKEDLDYAVADARHWHTAFKKTERDLDDARKANAALRDANAAVRKQRNTQAASLDQLKMEVETLKAEAAQSDQYIDELNVEIAHRRDLQVRSEERYAALEYLRNREDDLKRAQENRDATVRAYDQAKDVLLMHLSNTDAHPGLTRLMSVKPGWAPTNGEPE